MSKLADNITRRGMVAFVAACALTLTLGACGGNNAQPAKTDDATTTAETTNEVDTETPLEDDYTLVTEGKLTVVSDLDFPPLDSFENGEPSGFDVELSTEIAKRLGLEVEYLAPQDFDSIIPMIKQGGKADIGNSAFSITPEREEEIDFTVPYLDSNLGIAVKTGSGIASGDAATVIEELNKPEMTVAVQAGTTGEDWATEHLPDATIVPLASVTVCMTGVSTGQYNAFVADLPVIGYQTTASFTDCEIVLEIPTGEQYGIVVSEDNPGLTSAIDEVLLEMEEDGSLQALKTKWFGSAI